MRSFLAVANPVSQVSSSLQSVDFKIATGREGAQMGTIAREWAWMGGNGWEWSRMVIGNPSFI